MTEQQRIIAAVRGSENFKAECIYVARGNYGVLDQPRLYKVLEDDLVRIVFPTDVQEVEEGAVIAITCLYDRRKEENIYAHTICAGPGVNTLLRTLHAPLGGAHPQAGHAGERAIVKFVEWKQASWGRFLNEELELGQRQASAYWIRSFWKALDRLFGGGYLLNVPEEWYWRAQ
ncbi:MAG: hypothetical protein HYV26_16990 [Candidatus Hydrogenedentes bacterium]|nr:hypothetical protein [Candidatus Hydrogenedentota bacterium]